jgi:phenylalanyl-tRNA synthetase alpha chain
VSVATLTPEQLARALAVRDLSDPANGPHALQIVVERLIQTLTDAWGCPAILHRADPLISLQQNYERLRVPADSAARDARYTRYVDATTVLRTSATAMLPPLLERYATDSERYAAGLVHAAADSERCGAGGSGYGAADPDNCSADPGGGAACLACREVLLAPVGLVYRRDAIDRLHVSEPHQLDLWRIRHGSPALTTHDLEAMIHLVADVIAPGARVRCSATEHPYTLHGRQIDVLVDGCWVEIGECGIAHPDLLRDAGLSPGDWSGLAMGIGLDRAVMLRKGIDDIRLLRSEDPRVRSQMADLSAYRPVSSMPPVRRDLSLAVTPGTDAESIGDRVREHLGERAAAIEDLQVLSETPMDELPPQAIERIGIRPGQVNLLVRLVLRHPTETLTDHAANLLRDDVYAVLHEGSVHQWAAR